MKTFILLFCLSLITFCSTAQKDPRLLGVCRVKDLQKQPYSAWYMPGYENYTPDTEILTRLKSTNPEKLTVKIVFGSWCGDSKRELPRMMNVLTAAGFPEKNIQLIGVHDSLDVYKQAPDREEKV